jgi:MFS-type transporter involved in bile tolerance (Atg22 family)
MQDEYLGLFTVMSFTGLSIGSLLLSVLTRNSKGNRAFAIILALFSIGFGLYVWVNVTEGGILSALFGASSLAIAVWPRAKKRD